MLTLKNIKKTNDSISAEYFPEKEKQCGFIKVDLATLEIVEKRVAPTENADDTVYSAPAAGRLRQYIDNNVTEFPETAHVIWY